MAQPQHIPDWVNIIVYLSGTIGFPAVISLFLLYERLTVMTKLVETLGALKAALNSYLTKEGR